MATFHRLTVVPFGGQGTATINPSNDLGIYEAGTAISLTWTPVAGYTFTGWYLGGSLISTQQNDFIFVMPASDAFIFAYMTGAEDPVQEYGDYGLKYLFEWDRPRLGRYRIEIHELNYSGSFSEERCTGVSYKFGRFGGYKPTDILDPIVGSRIEFKVATRIAQNIFYTDLLDLDPRKFRVNFFIGYDSVTPENSLFKWVGYLMMDFFSRPEHDQNYTQTMIATDSLNSLDSERIQPQLLNGYKANQILAGFLNQTLINPRLPIRAVTEIWETRMDETNSVWDQFTLNLSRFFETSKTIKYTKDGFEINPYEKIKKGIQMILTAFSCRVFQWQNEWVIQRIPDLKKASFSEALISSSGTQQSYLSVSNSQPVQNIYNAQRFGALGYNEYQIDLNLGNIAVPDINSILVEPMEGESWYNYGGAQYYLKKWVYTNCQYFDGVRDSDVCRIERVTNPTSGEAGQFARFWGTANGISDPNLSYITYKSINEERPDVAVENANKITISMKYQILRRGSSDSINPPFGSHKVMFSLKIGSQYLTQIDATTFGWVGVENKIVLEPQSSGVFHSITLQGITVPETGDIEFSLYQLVTISGTRHRYIIDWEDVLIDIEQNSDISNEALEVTAIADTKFSNIYPKQDHYIGDAFTGLSASAIKLTAVTNLNEPSEFWTRDQIEAEKLQFIAIREMVNLFSKMNYRIQGKCKNIVRPDRVMTYEGIQWMVNAINFSDNDEMFEVDLFNLE